MMSPALTLALLVPVVLGGLLVGAEVRFTGDSGMSDFQIKETLGGRLDHITSQPAKPSRAADAAFMVEEIFRQTGFNEVRVDWKIIHSNLIDLHIQTGSRDLLGESEILGVPNKKLRKKLEELFELTPRKRATSFEAPSFRETDLEDGLALMRSQMHSLGFYQAELAVVSRERDPETGKINFKFKVDSGPMFTIVQPQITGADPSVFKEIMAPYVGRPARVEELNELRSRVINYYQSQGYADAKVVTNLEILENSVQPRFHIEQGRQITLRDVHVEGQEKTNPERINVRLRDLKGKPLNGDVTRKRIGQIVGTGAFESVRYDLTPVGDSQMDATLRIREGKARGLAFSAGFDTFEGPIFGVNYYDRNLLGQVWNLNAGVEISQRSLLGEFSIGDPWIKGSDLSGLTRVFALSRDFDGYKVAKTGLEVGVTWPVNEHYFLELKGGWTINGISSDGILPAELGVTSYQNPFLRFDQRIDFRDDPVMPTKGWHMEFPLEIGAAIGQGEAISYVRTEFISSWRRPIGESGRLALGLRGAALLPSDERSLPIDLRLFNGGPRSVRSFPERKLGPWSTTGYPLGGQSMWVANIEYSHAIAGPARGVIFFDAGSLSQRWQDMGFSHPKMALGVGLHVDLPIGPLRLDYGHSLNPSGHDPSGAFHFAIGATF